MLRHRHEEYTRMKDDDGIYTTTVYNRAVRAVMRVISQPNTVNHYLNDV